MDHSATFARHFARLVSLLMHNPAMVVEQKASLRALVAMSRTGTVTLVRRDAMLVANGAAVPDALTGVFDVIAQLEAHAIRAIRIAQRTPAAELLGLARIIAGAAAGDGGVRVREHLKALGSKGIEFSTPEGPTGATATEPGAPTTATAPPPPPDEAPTLVLPAEPEPSAPATKPAPVPVAGSAAEVLAQFIPPDMSATTPGELLGVLDAAAAPDAATRALDNLVLLAEYSMRVGRTEAVSEILQAVVTREAAMGDNDLKPVYASGVRRLFKPALLRGVAMLVSRKPEGRQYYYEILERAGEDGASALIEQVTQAPTNDDRRLLLEVLTELPDAIPALRRMLGDSRWFVARNAADLLGEMTATAAEPDLIGLLRHGDDRVRRAATNALLRLGTPESIKAIYEAVNDSAPEVRMQATAAIATRKDARTATTLIRAIEDEQDSDVQLAMIAALGKVGSPEAVQKLVRLAEAETRLFRRKTTGIRIAATQALGEARSPAALAALRELAGDKDRDVRDTATRALAQAGR